MKRVAVIVLAAGRSTRFAGSGAHKLLAPLAGVPVVRRSVQAAIDAQVGDVILVVGAEADSIAAGVSDLPVRVVRAERYADGMAESLRAGVESVRGQVEAVVISLADQPTMRPQAYHAVVATWAATNAAIVRPSYRSADVPGHPTLMASAIFDDLLALRGDTGARAIVSRDPSRVAIATLDWPAPHDIDTIDDLAIVAAEIESTDSRETPRTNDSNLSVRE